MTDAVVAWVDGNDPEHFLKREEYLKQEGKDVPGREDSGLLETRFKESGEIYYNIQLIRKNAPWIEKIFVITDNQRPGWLTEREAKNLGVRVVDHTEIFEGYEQYLPTFNSKSIETVMHRIKGLSPRFIYLNDDIFFIRPVKEQDYFDRENPVFRGHKQKRRSPWLFGGRTWKSEIEPAPGLIQLHLGKTKALRGRTKRAILYHAPHPIEVGAFAEIVGDRLSENIQYRFRNAAQFGPATLYANVLLQKGGCQIMESDTAYFSPILDPQLSVETISNTVEKTGAKHACFQSLDEYDEDSRQAAFQFLEACLSGHQEPDRSR